MGKSGEDQKLVVIATFRGNMSPKDIEDWFRTHELESGLDSWYRMAEVIGVKAFDMKELKDHASLDRDLGQ